MSDETQDLIDLALKYFTLGLNVTAVTGKRPAHKWNHLLSNRQTKEELQSYPWRDASGLGAITGVNDFYCLDFDKCTDAKNLDQFLIYLALFPGYSWVIQSGSMQGFHIWFKMDRDEMSKLKAFLNSQSSVVVFKPVEDGLFHQVELRMNQHVVLPPSKHDSGNRYKFYYGGHDLSTPPKHLTAFNVTNFIKGFCKIESSPAWSQPNQTSHSENPDAVNSSDFQKVMSYVALIEQRGIDITGNYNQWIRLMFSLINAFGLSAKDPLRTISRFYPTFSNEDFENQFENCLKSHQQRKSGTKVTLATFYFTCHELGIKVTETKRNDTDETADPGGSIETPYYDESIYNKLPPLLKFACETYHDARERDAFLISGLAVISGILPNVKANHRGSVIAPPFFVIVSAPPASGKHVITDARKLGEQVEEYFNEQYERDVQAYKEKQNQNDESEADENDEPINKQLFIPANSSSTAIHDSLFNNGGFGIVVEEEIDTLANALGQDWGLWSDLLRKAWGHEPSSYNRVGMKMPLWIKWPRLAMALGGTLNQVLRLVPSSEDGTFSRMVFYNFRREGDFVVDNVFNFSADNLRHSRLSAVGQKLLDIYKLLESHPGVIFSFTKEQGEKLTAAFQRSANNLAKISESDVRAIIARSMVVCTRLGMVLSVLRAGEGGQIGERVTCCDDDYFVISKLIKASIEHSMIMLSILPKNEHSKLKLETLEKVRFFEALPNGEFTRDDVVNTFIRRLGVKQRTAEGYLSGFVKKGLIKVVRNGVYKK